MELNQTGDGLRNSSVGKVFDDIVTMSKHRFDMTHDEAVACAKDNIAMMDSIPAVADWDWRKNRSKKESFYSLIEAGLRQRMSIIIIDALKKLPKLKIIVGLGEEAAAMLAFIAQDEDLSKLIFQEKIPHGMRLNNGFATEGEVRRYLGAIDNACAVLTGQSPRGLNDLNMGQYVTIANAQSRSEGISIHSEDGTLLAIARSSYEAADWTGIDASNIYTITQSQSNGVCFTSNSGQVYTLRRVVGEKSFGMTEAGKAVFGQTAKLLKRRRTEAEESCAPKKKFGFNIRSLDGETDFGTAKTKLEVAQWTGVSDTHVSNNLKRDDGFFTLNNKKIYRLIKVTEANDFGVTEAGKAEFERRRIEVESRRIEAEESCAPKKKFGFNIRSLDGETDFGTAKTKLEVAQWTGVCKDTVTNNFKRDDGFFTLNNKKIYRLSKVTEANESFGMTEAGKAEFERRRTEAEESCAPKKKFGFNIRSLDGETDFGTAKTKAEVAQWTGVCKDTVTNNFKRDDGFFTLNNKKIYRLSKVTEANESFGMTEAGRVEFERRRIEAEESCGFNIRSLDGETDFGTAKTKEEVAQWTGVSIASVSNNLKRDDGFFTLNNKKIYRLSKVTEANESFGMTEAGRVEFERRRIEAEESCGFNIRSLDGETDFGTAETKEEVAQWTGVSIASVSNCLQRNVGYLNLNRKRIYKFSKVTGANFKYGKTPAGETEFESRSSSPALIEVDAIAKANTKKRKSEKSEDSESQSSKKKNAEAHAPENLTAYVPRQQLSVKVKVENKFVREKATSAILPPRRSP